MSHTRSGFKEDRPFQEGGKSSRISAHSFLNVLIDFVTKVLTRKINFKGINPLGALCRTDLLFALIWSQLQSLLCWYKPHTEAWAELHCLWRRIRLRACMLVVAVAQLIQLCDHLIIFCKQTTGQNGGPSLDCNAKLWGPLSNLFNLQFLSS